MKEETYIARLKTKGIPELKKLAQETFNAYIRRRDSGQKCISCNSMTPNQAGHYYSRGSYPALALDEDNVFLQDISCNMYKHGNLIAMREGIIKRIGEERIRILDDKASYYKRNGWKPNRFYFISKIIEYRNK